MSRASNLRPRFRAVLFDCLGTLLRLDRPAERLQRALVEKGSEVPLQVAEQAFRSEIALYRENMHRGSDERGLRELRQMCADFLFRRLGELGFAVDLPAEERCAVMMSAVAFEPYQDARETLRWCKREGMRTAMVSNWDVSLEWHLERAGLREHVELVLASAAVGVEKPDAGLFRAALRGLGVKAAEAVHVGDEYRADVAGAERAGIRAVLLDRSGDASRHRWTIRSLAELPGVLARMGGGS